MRRLVLCLLLLTGSSQVWASHIIGGNVAISALGLNEGESTLSLTLIYDQLAAGTIQSTVVVSVFRKADNLRMGNFTLQREPLEPLPYLNANCTPRQLAQIVLVRYRSFVSMPAATYNAPEGYYIVWEQCCRNSSIRNLQNVNNAGLVFYTEIPPLTLRDNSPTFKNPEVKYACRGLGFELDFGALDFDNDELRYALVTPLAGSTDAGNAIPAQAQRGPYPRARWAAGFDSIRAVPSTSTMQINERTGKIAFTPTQLGRFVFSVLCQEFRDGKKIGEARRDYEITVLDCPVNSPPPVTVEIKSAPPSAIIKREETILNSVMLCVGDSITLKANDESPLWTYQWQLEGTDIADQNRVSATFAKPGNYTVVKSFAKGCESLTKARASVEILNKNNSAKIVSSNKIPLCGNDSTNLGIQSSGKNLVVKWERDGQVLSNTADVLPSIRQQGLYKATITDGTNGCTTRDSLLVKIVSPPQIEIASTGPTTFCANDSVKLVATRQRNYNYLWILNDMPIVRAISYEWPPAESGVYSVVATDTSTRCAARSNTIEIVVKSAPTATLDSIPPLCGIGIQAVTLRGSPAGGVYTGRGVVGPRFVTLNLAAGKYPVVYSVTNGAGCTSSATRGIIVAPAPRVQVPRQLTVLKGESVEIKTTLPDDATVQWSPATGLDNPRVPRPVAAPTRTTTYQVKIQTTEGCVIDQLVEIVVIDLKIPNGFTPNADGSNDTWEIEGIRNYPNCAVEVVNRWGNVVFKSEGYTTEWDGRYNDQPLPVGVYYYVVYLRESGYKFTGDLNIIR